jgi:phosphate acyltransferase
MRIAVDAMGGDHAPEAPVHGSLLAMPQCSAELLLIGNEKQLTEILGRSIEATSIRIVHASEVIGMGEAGAVAIRKKRGASLIVAMRLLAEGEVDAVVSAGNSAAIVAAARHFVGLIPGLRRPAIAVPLPTPTGKVLLIDAGAQAEANSIQLAQSAALANVYLKVTRDLDHPRVGLLNIGQEPSKGKRVIQRAFDLLQRSSLHFVGNVEPHDLYADRTDAAICDGFVGNLLLKMYEGLLDTLMQSLEAHLADQDYDHGVRERLGHTLQRFRGSYDYQSVGGAPVLGVRKTIIVAHGRSRAKAIASAILLASQLARDKVYDRISGELEKDGVLADLKYRNTALMLEQLRSKWGFTHKQNSGDRTQNSGDTMGK